MQSIFSRKLLVLFFAFFVVSIGLINYVVPKASAAAAVCYTTTADTIYGGFDDIGYAERVGCASGSSNYDFIEITLGHPPANDKCYALIQVSDTSVLPQPPSEFAASSTTCRNLATYVSSTSTTGPVCYKFTGAGSFIFNTGFDPSEISTIPCNDTLRDAIHSNSPSLVFSDFRNGWGYVVDSSNSLLYQTTRTALLVIITSKFDGSAPTSASGAILAGDPVHEDIANCDGSGTAAKLEKCLDENPIVVIITNVVNFLSVGAGVIITLMIVIAGIQYSTAGANPQAVGAAKGKLINAVLALLMLIFLYAFLQWLVPGGIF